MTHRAACVTLLGLMLVTSLRAAEIPRTDGIIAVIAADVGFGPNGTEVNQNQVKQILDYISQAGISVEIIDLEPATVSPGAIVATIKGLDPRKAATHTLFVYYAGHGATDQQRGHFLRTHAGDLVRSDLEAEIRAMNPPLAILLTDCCSSQATLRMAPVPAPPPPDKTVIENLFLQHRGIVDINASSYKPDEELYQVAFYDPGRGGLFTQAFFDLISPQGTAAAGEKQESQVYEENFSTPSRASFDRNKDGFLEWAEAASFVASSVQVKFESFKDEIRDGSNYAFVDPVDRQRIESQVSQDPQVFGVLAVKADQPIAQGEVNGRRQRLGASIRDVRGSGGVAITGITPGSPAARVAVWQNRQKGKALQLMVVGDTITRANSQRIRNIADLYRVIDTIPEGGELHVSGEDASTHKQYQATITLDRFEPTQPPRVP